MTHDFGKVKKTTIFRAYITKNPSLIGWIFVKKWQGHKDLNPEPTVLETAALPIELYPYM